MAKNQAMATLFIGFGEYGPAGTRRPPISGLLLESTMESEFPRGVGYSECGLMPANLSQKSASSVGGGGHREAPGEDEESHPSGDEQEITV